MRHHVVADFFFKANGIVIVDIVCVRFEFVNLFVGDAKAERLFAFRQRNPEFAPCAEFFVFREDGDHFLACPAPGERADIPASVRHLLEPPFLFSVLLPASRKSICRVFQWLPA